MKLTFKTLMKAQFIIDIEDDKTVKELKEKIEKEQGKDYPCSAQKLIYSGKILADECKISEYNINEKKFVVLMITRTIPAPKVQQTTEQSTTTTTTSGTSASAPVKKEEAKPKIEQPKTTTTTQSTASSVPSTAANNTTTTTTTNPTTTATTLQNQQPASRLLTGSEQPVMASRLAAMMNQPHFRQIQDLIQQSPHLLSSTIEALAGTDPEMYNFISDNPDIFVNALNHPPMPASRGQLTSRSSTTGSGQQQASDRSSQQDARASSGVRQQPVVDQILPNVSEHDKQAIERLKELGFSEYQAIQAYIACDKDEQLAANLLFQMEQ